MGNRVHESYGRQRSSFVDRFGVWLSRRAIVRNLPNRSGLEVLEPGCGYHATHLVGLQPRLQRGVGIDFQIAPEIKALERLTFYEGTIDDNLPKLEGQHFDAVLLISVLEHLPEPIAVIEATRGLLKPGGVLLINEPTWRGKAYLEFSAFRLGLSPKVEMDDHKMYFDRRDLWPLLVRAGFKPSLVSLHYHKFGLNLFAVAHREHV